MQQERKDCVWCGSELTAKAKTRHEPHFCPACDDIYEMESHLSLHPMEIRQPHND